MVARPVNLTVLALLGAATAAIGLSDAIAMTTPRIEDAATLKECGACHMVYPPQLLPQRSWEMLMSHLDTHFGETAAMDEDTRLGILIYLWKNAADANGANPRLLRGVPADATPERITELPWWKGRHEEVNMGNLRATKVKLASNCIGCHATADKGEFHE